MWKKNTHPRGRHSRDAVCKLRLWALTRPAKVDLAIVWGPLAGYFATKAGQQLRITPVEPEVDPSGLPFTFAISMGVRKGNLALRDQLEKILSQRAPDIRAILDEYGVPQLPLATPRDSDGVAN